ncbi:cytochrome P450 4c3-like, partial [Tropilaelaps mercedesae]
MEVAREMFTSLSAIQKAAAAVLMTTTISYLCLFAHRYYQIWKALRNIPGPFSKGLVGYIPPAYNIFCLVLQHAYAEFLETSTGKTACFSSIIPTLK